MEVTMEHPEEGTVRGLGIPVKLSGTPGTVRRAAPLLGEHTDRGAARGRPVATPSSRPVVSGDVRTELRGPALWVTFDRPEAHNAMTFAMYEALFEACERADADDAVRALVLRGAGGKAFVAGTDIAQFAAFESGEDGLRYEAEIDRIVGRLEAVGKPTVALVDGFAMGSGLALSADLRPAHLHAGGALRPADRPHRRQLPLDGQLRAAGRAARRGAAQGHRAHRPRDRGRTRRCAIGLATEVVEDAEARVTRAVRHARLARPRHDARHEGGAAAPARRGASGRRRPGPRGLRARRTSGTGSPPSWRSA